MNTAAPPRCQIVNTAPCSPSSILVDVTVVGNSIGGWIAAELALLHSHRISSAILVDAGGIDVAGQPVADIFSLTLDQLAKLSDHNPERFRIDQASLSDTQRAAMAANRATLRIYGGPMSDPTLRPRLAAIPVPTLVIWGDTDGIYTPDYGRAYAAAIPGARFERLPKTGHVPPIENPEGLLKARLGLRLQPRYQPIHQPRLSG